MSEGLRPAPGDQAKVSVSVAVPPAEAFRAARGGTEVTVIHRGWSSIRPDHPARHGLAVDAFVRMIGMWWGDLMTALRVHAERREG